MGKKVSLLLVSLSLWTAGCNRQDTECLSRIGRKVVDRANSGTSGLREKLRGFKGGTLSGNELQDKIALRLRWEKVLAEIPFEIIVQGKEIELKGTVKTQVQRDRAVELAESTVGVERVLVNLSIQEPEKTE